MYVYSDLSAFSLVGKTPSPDSRFHEYQDKVDRTSGNTSQFKPQATLRTLKGGGLCLRFLLDPAAETRIQKYCYEVYPCHCVVHC